jgi:predicted aspartyl protease
LTKAATPFALVLCLALAASGATHPASADSGTLIPITTHVELATFYVRVAVSGGPNEDYLLDTGSGYMTITDSTLSQLMKAGTATYVRELDGQMADGRVMRVAVYRLKEIIVGESCRIRDIEAAVLPGSSRGLFGLSALRRLSPFELSTDPPSLRLSNCLG